MSPFLKADRSTPRCPGIVSYTPPRSWHPGEHSPRQPQLRPLLAPLLDPDCARYQAPVAPLTRPHHVKVFRVHPTYYPSMQGLDSNIDPDYLGEPFIGRDGHFIGRDGFVVPANFIEFYERYPEGVGRWVSKRLHRPPTDADAEDWTQTLLCHLAQLPQGRTIPETDQHPAREIGGTWYRRGFTDVIHTFNPWAQYGASEKRFFNFISTCLHHKFSSLRSKAAKDATAHLGFYIDHVFNAEPSDDSSQVRDYLLMNRSTQYLNAVKANQTVSMDQLFVEQFKAFVQGEDPHLLPLTDAIMTKEKTSDILEALEVKMGCYANQRRRLVRLSKLFQTV